MINSVLSFPFFLFKAVILQPHKLKVEKWTRKYSSRDVSACMTKPTGSHNFHSTIIPNTYNDNPPQPFEETPHPPPASRSKQASTIPLQPNFSPRTIKTQILLKKRKDSAAAASSIVKQNKKNQGQRKKHTPRAKSLPHPANAFLYRNIYFLYIRRKKKSRLRTNYRLSVYRCMN